MNDAKSVIKNLRALLLVKGVDENHRLTVEGLTRSLAKARLSELLTMQQMDTGRGNSHDGLALSFTDLASFIF